MKLAVTGASGFVGRHLVRVLRDRGAEVVTPSRSELVSFETCAAVLSGCASVVHLAGRAHVLRESQTGARAAFREANSELTARLATASAAAGAERFIQMSSVGAVAATSAQRLTADAVPSPKTIYGESKLAAEEVARSCLLGSNTRHTVLRAPMMYGPHMKGNSLRLFGLIEKEIPLPFASVQNRRSVLYVDNLVRRVIQILEAPPRDVVAFVRDESDISTPEWVREIARALGVRARLFRVPPAMLRMAGRVGDLLPASIPFPLTGAGATGLIDSLTVDDSNLDDEFGCLERVSLRIAVEQTANWFRAR